MNKLKEKNINDTDMICCKLCEVKSHDLASHIIRIHKMNIQSYKHLYGEIRSKKYLKEQSERIKGNKNPAYQHSGKFSSLSDNFIYANQVNKKEIIEKIKNTNKTSGKCNTTLKYWTDQGFTDEEAKKKISERQTTFSKEICIEKYGEEEGLKRWEERQEKWHKSFKKSKKIGYSKVSQKLFWEIYNLLQDKDNIYFAELGKNKILDPNEYNNEYRLKCNNRIFSPDFINIKNKKILEFDGTYWHGDKIIKRSTALRDNERDNILIENGYEVLRIKEEDYKKNPQKVIKECLEFLNG